MASWPNPGCNCTSPTGTCVCAHRDSTALADALRWETPVSVTYGKRLFLQSGSRILFGDVYDIWRKEIGVDDRNDAKARRAKESVEIAARLQPLMREPQVIGHVPSRRLARGATPMRFAFYQGAA